MSERTCAHCGGAFTSTYSAKKFCTAKCRDDAKWLRRPRVPCSICGEPSGYPLGVVATATCNPCRRADWQHGTYRGYARGGCRCDECRRANTDYMLAYRRLIEEREGVSVRVKYRKKPYVSCAECGERLRFGGGGAPEGVEPRCLKCSRGRRRVTADVRLAVYERDRWACQLCDGATDPESPHNDPWHPTLDHITPVSMGGDDDPRNLRTAHRWCNQVRGVNDPHGLFEEAS